MKYLEAMTARFAPGDVVHTPLGKGQVLEVRNRSVLVRVQERAVLLDAGDIKMLGKVAGADTFAHGASLPRKAPVDRKAAGPDARGPAYTTLDVHGLTVDQALDAIDAALSEALLRDADELRVIHGRRGSRIRDALHRHVRGLSAVRTARLDPANAGVTIIVLS